MLPQANETEHIERTSTNISAHLAKAADLRELLRLVRRHLHANPEVGLQEIETHQFLFQVLDSHGFDVKGPVAGTGLFVDIDGAHPGPLIGFRADIDALPAQDGKSVSYASTRPGVAHLCGHDAHTAIAIGVALLLNEKKDHIHGRVRVFFQPNEEGHPSGAILMLEEGILEDMHSVFTSHVDPTLPLGSFGLRAGPITAAADAFSIQINGPGTAHAARPHQTTDVIWVATQIMNSLYQIVGRLHDARNTAVLTFTRIHAGSAYNVVPASLEIGGTLRCIDRTERVHLLKHIRNIATEYGRIYSANVEVKFKPGSPPVVNAKRLVWTVHDAAVDLFGEKSVVWISRPSMGAEDFAHYLEHIPGALIRIGTSDGPSTEHPLHDANFDIAEDSLLLAAELMSEAILRQGADVASQTRS